MTQTTNTDTSNSIVDAVASVQTEMDPLALEGFKILVEAATTHAVQVLLDKEKADSFDDTPYDPNDVLNIRSKALYDAGVDIEMDEDGIWHDLSRNQRDVLMGGVERAVVAALAAA